LGARLSREFFGTELDDALHSDSDAFLMRWLGDVELEVDVDATQPEELQDTQVCPPVHRNTAPKMPALDPSSVVVYALGPEDRERCVVGRDATCDIVIRDPTVSRFHAALELGGETSVTVIDKGSTNGTLVERRPVHDGESAELGFGKSLQFGQVKLTLLPKQQLLDFLKVINSQ